LHNAEHNEPPKFGDSGANNDATFCSLAIATEIIEEFNGFNSTHSPTEINNHLL
jgi:hypothetical protein